jgi:hypothetical protein
MDEWFAIVMKDACGLFFILRKNNHTDMPPEWKREAIFYGKFEEVGLRARLFCKINNKRKRQIHKP